jgi:hypothetical protein
MPSALKKEMAFRTGVVMSDHLGFILGGVRSLEEQDDAHTVLLQWTGPGTQMGRKMLGWTSGACCFVEQPKRNLLVVGEDGDYFVFVNGDDHEGLITPNDPDTGPFSGVYTVDGCAYAIGMAGTVYKWLGRATWVNAAQGMSENVDLQAIAGFASDEMYAVGWEGAMWKWDGATWTPIDSVTNVILTAVCCAPDGAVYICGQNGIVIKGRHDRWQVIDHQSTSEDLWDVHAFNGRIYLASYTGLFTLDQDQLTLVPFIGDMPSTCYHLRSRGRQLWSIGREDLFSHDGAAWTRLL